MTDMALITTEHGELLAPLRAIDAVELRDASLYVIDRLLEDGPGRNELIRRLARLERAIEAVELGIEQPQQGQTGP